MLAVNLVTSELGPASHAVAGDGGRRTALVATPTMPETHA
jgi:hypothetical protein